MDSVWFVLLTFLLVGYVVLDGFDLGAGAMHFFIARNKKERALILKAIGPVWDGNEVWLVAAGGTLFMAFPRLFSAAFSGFYLPLTIFVWLIVLRGLAIELRGHFESRVWVEAWDVVFSGSSALLAFVLGVALGNVVRGVPLDEEGWFFAPLWTDFGVVGDVGVIDWFTLIVGSTALAALSLHGATWIAVKTSDVLEDRSLIVARRAWWITVAMTTAMTAVAFSVQPQIPAGLTHQPWGAVFPMVAVLGLAAVRVFLLRGETFRAFLASASYLAGMLASVAFGLFPLVLPSTTNPAYAMTVSSSRAPDYGLTGALWWWIPGMMLVLGYTHVMYRGFAGKVDLITEDS